MPKKGIVWEGMSVPVTLVNQKRPVDDENFIHCTRSPLKVLKPHRLHMQSIPTIIVEMLRFSIIINVEKIPAQFLR